MTLLISTLRRPDVLVTADGRTTLREGSRVTGFRDKTQKLFPVDDQPVVICQHGQNVFDGHPIAQIIREFARSVIPGSGIRDIADRLAVALHDEVRETLWRLPRNNAAGLWVVGFGRGEDEPEHVEVFWKWEEDRFVSREGYWRAVDVILAGDGKTGIHPNLRDIEDASLPTVQSVHAGFMAMAMTAQVNPNTVGGHVHEVIVRPWGWEWTLPPAVGA